MILKALLLIAGIILFLIMTILSLVFMIIGMVKNKRYKHFWLGSFIVSLILAIFCITTFIRKTNETVDNLANKLPESIARSLDQGMREHPAYEIDSSGSKNMEHLLAITPDSLKQRVPREFYHYLGYLDYYRFPLRYPYAIHCVDQPERGMLYNEKDVVHFDQNDNGEISMNISEIDAIAFDDRFLLIQFTENQTGETPEDSYLLFEFDKERKTKVKSLKKLFDLAKSKGYTGPRTLTPVEEHYRAFF
jgi:hypothetical protein